MVRLAALLPLVFLFLALPAQARTPVEPETDAEEPPSRLWLVSGEVGVGPIEEELFLHLPPRLTFLQRLPALLCTDGDCNTYFEAALQVPLRLRMQDDDDQGRLRGEDWLELSDFFRVIRRLEYGDRSTPLHVKVGELGPANLGHGTIVNGYYNVVSVDHYRLGLMARLDRERYGGEVLVNNLLSPNLLGLRAHARPPGLFERGSSAQSFSLGASVVTDLRAPTLLARDGDELVAVGPDRNPEVAEHQPTVIVGGDLRWHGLQQQGAALTPYVDINHHFGLGSGLHTGAYYSHSFFYGALNFMTRLEFRLLQGQYLPDYVDPLYELTRFQTPSVQPGLAGPKLRVARSNEEEIRHGGFAEIQARILGTIRLSAAYADETGPSAANLRLRISADFAEARVGLFYYKFALSTDDRSLFRELVDRDGALVAAEARTAIWGPFYAQALLAQQWLLRDDGHFDNVVLWNAGAGAGFTF